MQSESGVLISLTYLLLAINAVLLLTVKSVFKVLYYCNTVTKFWARYTVYARLSLSEGFSKPATYASMQTFVFELSEIVVAFKYVFCRVQTFVYG